MLKKVKIIRSLFYIKSIFFLFSTFILQVNAETKIIAKNGDTLLKLSKQYGIELKELMHKNNFIDANKIIEGELIIIPLESNNKNDNKAHIVYEVKEGDTLYKIARNYRINVKEIIDINNLSNASYLKSKQRILIPYGSEYKKISSQENIKIARKKVFYHQTSRSQEIGDIAIIHNVYKDDIITLNKLNNPTIVNPNTKLKIRKHKTYKWLQYGSILINWSDWTYLDGDYITRAKNKNNKSFYLAINCEERTLNNTLNNSYWTNWYFPEIDFEFKLINDFCDKGSEI